MPGPSRFTLNLAALLLLGGCATTDPQEAQPVQASLSGQPRIRVLGAAQDGGFPHAACRCPRCAAAHDDPARARLVVDDERSITLKGKAEPEQTINVGGLTSRADDLVVAPDAAPLVGRDQELADLAAAVGVDSGLTMLTGPAGAGKTRLAEALLARLPPL